MSADLVRSYRSYRFLRAELPADADLVAELRVRTEQGWHLVWIERDDRGKVCLEMAR